MRVRPASEFRDTAVPRTLTRGTGAGIRVLKFGGTSLAGADRFEAAVSRVAALRAAGILPIVVVSALGGTTDRLIQRARTTGADRSPRELDALLATGEAAAAALFAGGLERRGVASSSLAAGQAGIVSDDRHGAASIEWFDPEPICGLIGRGVVPIVAGFQARDRRGEITTLGRGGSDTTAVACAVAMGRVLDRTVTCEILTDVPGVHSIDPRESGVDARPIACMSHRELLALAEGGSRIVAVAAARLAAAHDVPLAIAESPGSIAGTLVTHGTHGTHVASDLAMATNEFAIATATDRVMIRRGDRGNVLDRIDAGTLQELLGKRLGPTPFQIADDAAAIVVPACVATAALEALLEHEREREHDEAERWTIGPARSAITVVSGLTASRPDLPEPACRLGPGVAVWTPPAEPLHEHAVSWHARMTSPQPDSQAGTEGNRASIKHLPEGRPHRNDRDGSGRLAEASQAQGTAQARETRQTRGTIQTLETTQARGTVAEGAT